MDKATSYKKFKPEVLTWIFQNINTGATILDVGAGSGTYFKLLGGVFHNIDAVEIYRPNIVDYELEKKYRKVFNENIVGFEYEWYDLVIIGDVLEHLTIKDAKEVLQYAEAHCGVIIVAVPYQHPQDRNENNYEKHIQDDLTPMLMSKRYPELSLLFGNNKYGYYIWHKG